jgi:hypothetical protein
MGRLCQMQVHVRKHSSGLKGNIKVGIDLTTTMRQAWS